MDNIVELLFQTAYQTILAEMPKWTRNMMINTTMSEDGESYVITVSGPLPNGGNYARKVNEQRHATRVGPNKGKINYRFVERSLEQAGRVYGIVEVDYGV